jgi:hypothetical protein
MTPPRTGGLDPSLFFCFCVRRFGELLDRGEEPAWSDETWQASWIGARLAPFGASVVTSVVPGGFEVTMSAGQAQNSAAERRRHGILNG